MVQHKDKVKHNISEGDSKWWLSMVTYRSRDTPRICSYTFLFNWFVNDLVIHINTQIRIVFDDTSSYTVIDNPDDSSSIVNSH